MRFLLALVFCFVTASLLAQKPEQPIKTTLCQIKAAPMDFNKKLVEVSGYATHGLEDSMFEDPTCFWGTKLPGIWMEYGGTSSTDTMYCCGFSPSNQRPKQLVVQNTPIALVRDEVFERMDKLLHSKPREDVSVQATVFARIFAVQENVNGKPNGFMGYGHMGCCLLLAITRVESVDSKTAEPSIFELARAYEKKAP